MNTATLHARNIELEAELDKLKNQINSRPVGRKQQVLDLLRAGETSIDSIAETIGINNKNVSSQLTYLRKDGHRIYTIRIDNVTTLKLEE